MGEVAIRLRVMPDDVERDLDELKDALLAVLPDNARFGTSEKIPIGFGLSSLDIVVVMEDCEGGSEEVESRFSAVDGVENITVVEVGLI
jgi:elongation factor 1-beta